MPPRHQDTNLHKGRHRSEFNISGFAAFAICLLRSLREMYIAANTTSFLNRQAKIISFGPKKV